MKREFLAEIHERLAQRRQEKRRKKEREAKERMERLYEEHPRLVEIEREIRDLYFSLGRLVVLRIKHKQANEAEQEEIKKQIEALKAERDRYFEQLGLPRDYLEPQWDCKICQDTGFTPDEQDPVTGRVRLGHRCRCQVLEEIKEIYNYCEIPMVDRSIRFDSVDWNIYPTKETRYSMKVVASELFRYAEQIKEGAPGDVVLAGTTGSGKTFWATATLNHVIDAGLIAMFIPFAEYMDIVNRLRFTPEKSSTADDALRDYVRNCPFLVLDDLGDVRITTPVIEELKKLLDYRKRKGLSTLVTTNLTPAQIGEAFGDRIESRLIGDFHWIHMAHGIDMRMVIKKAKEQQQADNVDKQE